MAKPGRVFSRAQLLDSVWGLSIEIDERTVDVHVGRLRKALSQDGEKDPIRTVRGAGLRLRRDVRRIEPPAFRRSSPTRRDGPSGQPSVSANTCRIACQERLSASGL